jgi:hypothetical protein
MLISIRNIKLKTATLYLLISSSYAFALPAFAARINSKSFSFGSVLTFYGFFLKLFLNLAILC